jgi:hypothetical protein
MARIKAAPVIFEKSLSRGGTAPLAPSDSLTCTCPNDRGPADLSFILSFCGKRKDSYLQVPFGSGYAGLRTQGAIGSFNVASNSSQVIDLRTRP